MEQTWGMDLIRSFFGVIDKAVYSLMATIYQIILDISNTTVLSTDVIQDLYSRMYTLLGIFMLFKVTFSFINYLINPDSFTEKQKGVQYLVRNVLLVLILIIITPFAFDKLYEVQDAILSDNLIPRFLLGVNNSSSDAEMLEHSFQMSDECPISAVAASDGDYLALTTLRPFYQLEESTTDIPNGYCDGGNVTPATYLVSKIYNSDKTWEDVYLVDYKFFLSTIVGIVVCLILVSFCFDIAVRSIKLGFLEMLAPIPIMSYIDPASSKNGMFSKWLKQVGSTWASLFIRLIALFFAVLVISKIDISIGGSNKFWVMLFILIGALIFAKQLPKLLEELIPGLKLGGMQLNPFKKIANDAIGGKQLLGLGAGALGLGVGATSWAGRTITNKIKNGAKNKEENLAKRVDLAERRYGVNSPEANALVDKWEKAAEKLENHDAKMEAKKLKRENLTDIRGKLHIDEMALHPVTNTMKSLLHALSSMGDAAKSGYKQGSSQKFNPFQMGIDSAKEQDKREKYNTYERIKDTATDFFGIKNESGTTSKIKEDIKEQTENLRKIQSTLAAMEHSFSGLQQRMGSEFYQAFNYDNKSHRYVFNPNYTGQFAAEAHHFSNTIASLDKEYASVQKELKKLQGLQDKIKPPK